MSIKPHICGKNMVNLPTSGCSDCAELEYRIKQLEDWVADPIDTETLESLTPLECYEPPCAEPIVCQTTVCCAKAGCTQEEVEPTEVSQ